KARLRRGNRQIAGRDELAARSRRDAVHLGDDRLWQTYDLQHQRAALRKDPPIGLAARLGDIIFAAQFAQIMPGAASGSGAGDEDDPARLVGGGALERLL